MLKLFKELKRRKVLTTLGVYAGAAVIIIQVADVVFPALRFPDWTVAFVVVLVFLGFPITFFLSWTYDLKREGGTNNNSGYEDAKSNKKSKNVLLPITGFLTIIGIVFWAWYSLGDVTSASDLNLQIGIKKSIAVMKIKNNTSKNDNDRLCSGISVHIRSVLASVGKLDVKSRLASLHNNITELNVDYIIDGELYEVGGERKINISLVEAKSKSILKDYNHKFDDDDNIFTYQDTIIKNILTELEIDPSVNGFISNKSEYGNVENFKLIGEGIISFDNKNYPAAIKAFNSVLESDPKNIVALYHKANCFYGQNKFTDAMQIYESIFDSSDEASHIGWQWQLPKKETINQTLCTNIELVGKKELAIMLFRDGGRCRLVGFNPESKTIVWETHIDDKYVSSPVIINNTIFLTSNRIRKEEEGEPTLYTYNLEGIQIFAQEYPRDNENQGVIFTISEEYSNISDDNSTILLSFNKIGQGDANYRELALIETENGSIKWRSKIDLKWSLDFDVMLINVENTNLLTLILEHDVMALNYKDGTEVWRENFLGSGLSIWNQKIFETNLEEKYIAIWDPLSRKEIWKYSHDRQQSIPKKLITDNTRGLQDINQLVWGFGVVQRSNQMYGWLEEDVVLLNFNDGNIVAINFDGGLFNWNRERWTQKIGIAEKIWVQKNISNRMFCLTRNDSLFTINMTNGNIIKRFAIDGHDYNVYFDHSKNAMVLNNAEFFIGVDPINGDQLWKIRANKMDNIELTRNSVWAIKTISENSILLINNYNRDNGNLIGSENIDISKSLRSWKMVAPVCKPAKCIFCGDFTANIDKYSDESTLVTLHDKIIRVDAMRAMADVVQKKDVRLQIAKTYERGGKLDRAIKEYMLLIEEDQMNQVAYWNLANIFQQKNQVNEAVKQLINYYDLILPTSSAGIKTIYQLKKLEVLTWEKNMGEDGFLNPKIAVDSERVFIFENNQIQAYRINSGTLIWKKIVGDKNTKIVDVEVENEKHIFFIKKNMPDMEQFYFKDYLAGKKIDLLAINKASTYHLVVMNKKGDKISLDVPLNIPGESKIKWMGATGYKLFIQSIIQYNNKISVSAYDIVDGKLLWEISRDISSHYTPYDLYPALYSGNLLLPLDDKIEYINTNNGNINRNYSDEDIDNIYFFNQNSIQNNTMKFFIEDIGYGYVVVDLDNNIKISSGPIDFDNPELGRWSNDVFVDVSSSGSVAAYKLPPDTDGETMKLWEENDNTSLRLVGVDEQNISLLDMKNEQITLLNAQLGTIIKSAPLLWPGENIKMMGDYFIIQSANKLYVVPI